MWKRFVTAMVTSQTRITASFWERLNEHEEWRGLVRANGRQLPTRSSLERCFRETGIRFPRQKAERLKTSRNVSFEELASATRGMLASTHDRGASWKARRQAEVRIAELVEQRLRGAGVAPKIARLMLTGTGDCHHLVPIDSRWLATLARLGVVVSPQQLSRESGYRLVEDQIVRAAHELRVHPVLADGIAFGWLLDGGAR